MTAGTYTGSYGSIVNPSVVSFTLTPGGTISGNHPPASVYATTAHTFTNLGKVANAAAAGVQLKVGGSVINGSPTDTSAYIKGYSTGVSSLGATPGTVTNYGVIISTYRDSFPGPFGFTNADNYHTGRLGFDGVYLRDGGKVANTGAAADIYGWAGIESDSGALSISNAGTIAGYSAGIYILQGSTGLTLNNSGLITSRVNEAVNAYTGTVSITNTGTVFATGTVNEYVSFASALNRYPGGIYVGQRVSAGATIANGNSTNNTALIEGYAYGIGVYSTKGATITNWGTIQGNGDKYIGAGGATISQPRYAISFASSGTAADRVIAEPGSAFIGVVNGGGAASVLELASSASAGTLTSAGGQFTNFSALNIDSGARWTIKGDGGLASAFSQIGGFTAGDTISLTGLAQTPTTFASSVDVAGGTTTTSVIIQAGSTDLETLTLLGSIAPDQFSFNAGATSTLTEIVPPPTITASGTVTFTGGGAPVAADPGLVVTDPSGTLVSATVTIGGFITGDTLTVGTAGGLGASFSAGTFTLTGSASVTTYEAALESVDFGFEANGDPTGGGVDTARTIDWLVDNGGTVSNTGTSTVDTVHVGPTITAPGTTTFNGGGGAVALDSEVTVADGDSGGVLSSATVTIVSPLAGDTLSFTNAHPSTEGNIAVSSDSGGVLVLTSAGSTATVAQWGTALDSVQYNFTPSDDDPTNGGVDNARTIDWLVNDGVANSGTAVSTLDTLPPPISEANSSIIASPSTVTADGVSTTTLTVTLEDAGGVPLAGTAVTLSGSGAINTFTNVSGFTDSNGVFTATLSSTLEQTETVTATEGSSTEDTTVTFVAGPISLGTSSFTATPVTVAADGTSTTTLTLTLEDANANPIVDTAVTLSADGSFNTFTPVSGFTDAYGDFTATLASTLAQSETVTATEGSVTETVPVTFVGTTANFDAHVYLDTNADGSQDDGETGLAGVTVNLLDGSGNPTGQSLTTDGNGDVSFTGLAPGSYEIGVVTPGGDVATQTTNTLTPNTLSAGETATATEGVYAPPALSRATLNLTVAEGQSLANIWAALIANGVDPDPSSLTISAVGTAGTNGFIVLNAGTDSLTYLATGLDPSNPVDAFTYTLKDGGGGTVTGTVDVTITGPNLPTTVATKSGTTAATGSGQRLISEGAGQTLQGSPVGGDELFGGSDTTIVGAGSGNTIYVEPGNHAITMGANNNTLTLNDGNNAVIATGTGNTVTGGNGNDSISGMTGSATITLGNGNDTVSVSGANNQVTVGTGTDKITAGNGGNETVVAGNGANTISAGGANDSLTTGNGVSKITATGASATIVGGNGGDTVVASAAGDKITTGTGNDTITVTAGSATIKAGLGVNTIKFAGSGNDVINQGGTDTLTDSGTNNTIALPLAGAGLDTINGSVLANGDTFDLRAAMAATTWDQQMSDLGLYLSTGTSGSNALVQLSVTSGGTPITIAVLNGQGSVSLSSFESHSLLT